MNQSIFVVGSIKGLGLSVAKKFSETFKNLTAIHGSPDVLFYNVGITTPDDKSKMNAQTLLDHYRADVAGAFNCIQLVDTEEFAKNHGAILITGGGLALNPFIDYLPLSMDKAALCAMTPALNSCGIYIGTLQVTGTIGSNDHFAPKKSLINFGNYTPNVRRMK